jgi:hypothetical protein
MQSKLDLKVPSAKRVDAIQSKGGRYLSNCKKGQCLVTVYDDLLQILQSDRNWVQD